jgi:hypothetical protein
MKKRKKLHRRRISYLVLNSTNLADKIGFDSKSFRLKLEESDAKYIQIPRYDTSVVRKQE